MRVLPHPGGPYSRIPLGAGSWCSVNRRAVQVRQLDRVGDGLDLLVEAAHVRVGDVGHLLEDELLDLGAGQLLDAAAAARVSMSTASPARRFTPEQVVRPARRPAPRRPGRTTMARRPSSRTSLSVTTSPESSPSRARITFSDSLSTTSWPRRSSLGVDLGVHGDAHLAAAGEDVDGAVVVGAQEGAVGARRLGELVHFFAQGGDVLLGLLQGVGQLLVLRDGLGELALGLEQPLLEGLDPPGALRQPPPQDGDLLFGLTAPLAQSVELARVARAVVRSSRLGRRNHLLGMLGRLLRPYADPERTGAHGRGTVAPNVGSCGRVTVRHDRHRLSGVLPVATVTGQLTPERGVRSAAASRDRGEAKASS